MRQYAGRAIALLFLVPAASGAALAQPGGATTATLTFGHYDVDTAADRDVASLLVSSAVSAKTRFNFELVGVSREEDAEFASLGLSHDLGAGSRLSYSFGFSNSELGVFPENRLVLGYEYATPADVGYVFRTALELSDFAMDAESTALRGEVVRYFPPNADGSYLVGQIGGTVTRSDPGAEIGWELTVAGTVVRPGGWTYGLSASTGTIGYEGALSMPIENDFVAIRPLMSYAVSDNLEVVARGDFVDSDNYKINGLSLSVILDF